ncbi:hypothetical protein TNIN_75411 [Trichonephila inaurata madagascariensis]|uniref:Uncharacterized protein n=1 Tax=Trichonephila inaurata madagascariensis TaxID=2747483 RepID=A0A8X7BT54_9ARAC|nr:hypothetical protein TNIN_75411 [Trichonephila inaurata madagascariensis]
MRFNIVFQPAETLCQRCPPDGSSSPIDVLGPYRFRLISDRLALTNPYSPSNNRHLVIPRSLNGRVRQSGATK